MSGMTVHDLRDMRSRGTPTRYAKTFDETLREAVEADVTKDGGVEDRDEK